MKGVQRALIITLLPLMVQMSFAYGAEPVAAPSSVGATSNVANPVPNSALRAPTNNMIGRSHYKPGMKPSFAGREIIPARGVIPNPVGGGFATNPRSSNKKPANNTKSIWPNLGGLHK